MNISDEQKIYELSRIWKEAAYNFAFWDKLEIDWDEEYKKALERVLATKDRYEYYRELTRFVALLNDGHTAVMMPMDMMRDPEYFSILPVYLWSFGDEIRVLSVGQSVAEQVPLGSRLVKIDGTDAAEYVKEKCYPYIWHGNENACGVAAMNEIMLGRSGSEAKLTFEKDGEQCEVVLKREDPAKVRWSDASFSAKKDYSLRTIGSSDVHRTEMTEDNIAVIRMTSFQDDSLPGKIYAEFEQLKEAKAFIVDVRANQGGNSANADAIASLFIRGDFKSCFGETQVYEPTYKAWAMFREDFAKMSLEEAKKQFADSDEELKAYRMRRNIFFLEDGGGDVTNNAPGFLEGPIVVLMNENTVSAAEDFVDVMKKYTGATFVGQNTAGTSGQPLFESLESGGMFRFCTRRCIAQNGEDIYNKGFAPDVRVAQTFEDFAAGRDRAFEQALEILRR